MLQAQVKRTAVNSTTQNCHTQLMVITRTTFTGLKLALKEYFLMSLAVFLSSCNGKHYVRRPYLENEAIVYSPWICPFLQTPAT